MLQSRPGRGPASETVFHSLSLGLSALVVATLALAAIPARADAPGAWREGAFSRARMAAAGAGPSGARWVVVEVALQPGWRTYWRWPGASGLPPRLDWSGSTPGAAPAVVWPTPTRFDVGGETTYGYRDRVVLAAAFPAGADGTPAMAELTLDIAVCAEICAPERYVLSAPLDAEGPSPDWAAALREEALAAAPEDARSVGVEILRCAARRSEDGGTAGHGTVDVEARLPEALREAEALAAPPNGAGFERLRIERGPAGALRVSAELLAAGAPAPEPGLTVLLIDADGVGAAYEACAE